MDPESVRKAVDGCDVVVHMASIAGVDTVLKHPVDTMRISLLGTANVLEAAYAAGRCKRFVDFSTSEVFGRYAYHVTEFDATTLGAVGEARWTYAVAKLATEHLAMTYHRQYAFPAVSVRPFNIYGPRQVGEGAVHHFIVRALKGEPLTVHNQGAQIRAWCYIDDIVDAMTLVLTDERAVGHAFNIGNPRSTVTIYNLAREIMRLSSSGFAHRVREVEQGRRGAACAVGGQGRGAARVARPRRPGRGPAAHHLLVPEPIVSELHQAPIPLARPLVGTEEEAAVLRALRSGRPGAGAGERCLRGGAARRRAGGAGRWRYRRGRRRSTSRCGRSEWGRARPSVCRRSPLPATANVVRLLGAEVELVDVNPVTWCMRLPERLEGRPRSLVVHQFGFPGRALDGDVSDAACAAGVPGAMQGACACLSFHPRKVITTGEGGAIVGDDEGLRDELRRLRSHGLVPRSGTAFVEYDVERPATNYRLSEPQAAMGRVQLARLPALLEERRALVARYRTRLARRAGDPAGRHAVALLADLRRAASARTSPVMPSAGPWPTRASRPRWPATACTRSSPISPMRRASPSPTRCTTTPWRCPCGTACPRPPSTASRTRSRRRGRRIDRVNWLEPG